MKVTAINRKKGSFVLKLMMLVLVALLFTICVKWRSLEADASSKHSIIAFRTAPLVKSIVMNKRTVILKKGSSYQLQANLKPSNPNKKKLFYSVTNERVAYVSRKGKIIGKKEGFAMVGIRSTNAEVVYVKVKVLEECKEYTIAKGKTLSIIKVLSENSLAQGEEDAEYCWVSRRPSVAKIINNTSIKAMKSGTAYIEGNSLNGRYNRLILKITVGVPTKSVKVGKSRLTMMVGDCKKVKATIKPWSAANKNIRYSSTNTDVAMVDNVGNITAVGAGTANIQVVAQDGRSSNRVKVRVNAPIIRTTTHGQIKGMLYSSEVLGWFGVPYAKPPVGELRWRAPQELDAWSGILPTQDATKTAAHAGGNDSTVGSEDCLYLNIFRPNTNDTDLPVIVYLHSGGNVSGSAWKNFKNLAVQTNAIIISVEYRLGAFGWLNVPALKTGDREEDSGNFALLDIKKALEWVNLNAVAFGGDQNNVTLSGFSAGARNVLACMISPTMKGLFSKAMSFSGGMGTVTPEEGQKSAYNKFAAILVNRGEFTTKKFALKWLESASNMEVKSFLYSLTKQELANMYKYTGLILGNSPQLFTDGYVLPASGFDVVTKGDYIQVPMILGSNASEFATYSLRVLETDNGIANGLISVALNITVVRQIANLYGSLLQSGYYVEENAEKFLMNSTQPNIYGYRMRWGENASITGDKYADNIGALHGMDIKFLCGIWNNPYKDYAKELFNDSNLEGRKKLSLTMQKYIGNFIRTGDPNETGLKGWDAWNSVPNRNKIMMFDADNIRNTSYMSSEYLDVEKELAYMKNGVNTTLYDLLINYIFNGRCFMPSSYRNTNVDNEQDDNKVEDLVDDTSENVVLE